MLSERFKALALPAEESMEILRRGSKPDMDESWEPVRVQEFKGWLYTNRAALLAGMQLAEAVDRAERVMSTDGEGGATPADLLSTMAIWTGDALDKFRSATAEGRGSESPPPPEGEKE